MFLTLQEYLLGATKLLALYGYNCHKQDEDAISYVASYMMRADQSWDGKSSSRNTWRFNYAKYAILNLKTQHQKRRKHTSLNTPITKNSAGKQVFLEDILVDKQPKQSYEDFDYVMKYAEKNLTNKEFVCLKSYYYDQMTLQEIGNKLQLTRERIRQIIKMAITKLQYECKSQFNNSTY